MRFAIIGFGLLMASTVPAQSDPSSDTTGQIGKPGTSISNVDEVFVDNAGRANMAQIGLGKLAVRKGSTEKVRQMGQKMIDDHRKLGDKLQLVASREGLSLPTQVTREQQATHDHLSSLSGAEFDKAFIEQLKSDHQEAISLFEDESQHGTDLQLKSFAESTLPSLRHHQQMVTRQSKMM
jgi:putative membrane protein